MTITLASIPIRSLGIVSCWDKCPEGCHTFHLALMKLCQTPVLLEKSQLGLNRGMVRQGLPADVAIDKIHGLFAGSNFYKNQKCSKKWLEEPDLDLKCWWEKMFHKLTCHSDLTGTGTFLQGRFSTPQMFLKLVWRQNIPCSLCCIHFDVVLVRKGTFQKSFHVEPNLKRKTITSIGLNQRRWTHVYTHARQTRTYFAFPNGIAPILNESPIPTEARVNPESSTSRSILRRLEIKSMYIRNSLDNSISYLVTTTTTR